MSRLTNAQRARVEEWILTLEEVGLKQTQGNLKTIEKVGKALKESYCCLGVACEIYGTKVGGYFDITDALNLDEARDKVEVNFVADEIGEYGADRDEYAGTLPPIVAKWFGLNDETEEAVTGILIEMNDNDYSFKDIALFLRVWLKRPKMVQEFKDEFGDALFRGDRPKVMTWLRARV
jgi:hypothetical protein